jgi:5,10-methylenetetrahydrofolate reductase
MIGTSVTALRPNAGWKGDSCSARSSAGARFLQTQPCLSIPMLRHFMQRLVELRFTWKFAVIVTLAPLPGMKAATWQIEQATGVVIPKVVLNQLAEAPDPEQAGILLCAQQIREIATIPGVSGVNLLTLGNPAAVIAAIEASGVRGFKHLSVAG